MESKTTFGLRQELFSGLAAVSQIVLFRLALRIRRADVFLGTPLLTDASNDSQNVEGTRWFSMLQF